MRVVLGQKCALNNFTAYLNCNKTLAVTKWMARHFKSRHSLQRSHRDAQKSAYSGLFNRTPTMRCLLLLSGEGRQKRPSIQRILKMSKCSAWLGLMQHQSDSFSLQGDFVKYHLCSLEVTTAQLKIVFESVLYRAYCTALSWDGLCLRTLVTASIQLRGAQWTNWAPCTAFSDSRAVWKVRS